MMGDDLKFVAYKKLATTLNSRYEMIVGVGQESKKMLPADPEVNP